MVLLPMSQIKINNLFELILYPKKGIYFTPIQSKQEKKSSHFSDPRGTRGIF